MRQTRWIVLGLLVATGAAGCGTENPTGPSFERSAPPLQTAVSEISIVGDPGETDPGTWNTGPEPGSIDRRTGLPKKPKRPHPQHPNHP